MGRGRKAGTKLSEAHKESLRGALKEHFKNNVVWNKGAKKIVEKVPPTEAELEQKRLNMLDKVKRSAIARKKNTALKLIKECGERWSNVSVVEENKTFYVSMTHTCGTNIKVQAQTVRKWDFGDGLCKTCNPVFRGVSKAETSLHDFVQSIQPDTIRHSKLPSGLEIDMLIPSKKIAIEYDGLYWHSDKVGYSATKHLDKTIECEKQELQLIHVFEDEWIKQPDIVKSRLQSLLGKGERIFARKLFLDMNVSSKEAGMFLERTHIQGNAVASKKIGLRDANQRLLAIMTFGRSRFDKSIDWELIRYASELNTNIVGGASRLFSAFKKSNTGSVISYADRRWSQGKLYHVLGFQFVRETAPAYHYFKGDLRENRQTFQKHKLEKAFPEIFSAEKTEYEIMSEAGWNRIWDCGNLTFIWKLNEP